MRTAVRIDETVKAEITVVLKLPEISAVPVHGLSVPGRSLIDRVVAPFPDESSAQTGIFLDQLPVLLQIARAVSHGVAVLYEEERFFRIGVQIIRNIFEGRVHSAEKIDIGYVIFTVMCSVKGTLIGRQSGRINFFCPSEGFLKGAAVTAFITHGPDEDRGTVAVPYDHGTYPVQCWLDEVRIVRNSYMSHTHPFRVIVLIEGERTGTMAFVVSLVDHVEAEFITQLVEPGNIRVMTCPDRIKVMLLDHMQVLFDPGSCLDKTCDRIRFMPVDAPEFNRSIVEIQDAVFDTDVAEAYALGDSFPLCLHDEGVQVWRLSVPKNRIFYGNVNFRDFIQGYIQDDLTAPGRIVSFRGKAFFRQGLFCCEAFFEPVFFFCKAFFSTDHIF